MLNGKEAVEAGPTSSSFIQPVPPGSTAAHHSLMSPISNGRSLSISVPSMPLSNREEALQNEVLALHNELLTLRATIKALENSSHAWRILNDSSKIKGYHFLLFYHLTLFTINFY